ncbi:MAG TPA: glycosyl transferase, partial [Pseudomonas sp.]|nr:glycosyl transferase [Pseudomonas sp.]
FRQEIKVFIDTRVREVSLHQGQDALLHRPTVTPASITPVYPAAVPMKHA